MTHAKEDIEGIKKKLFEHIEKTYDKEKADGFKANISNMNDEQFIEFLKQQGLIPGGATTNCVFCKMVFGEIPTTKIGENEDAIAILELNPISHGHAMIIPKAHVEAPENLSDNVGLLANIITDEIKRTFNPKRVDFIPGNIMGHEIINILPIYGSETIDSPRTPETPEGLAKIKEQIINSKPKVIEASATPTIIEENLPEQTEEINETNTWLPKKYRNF